MKDPSGYATELRPLLEQGLRDRYALLSGAYRPTLEEALADRFNAEQLQPYREALDVLAMGQIVLSDEAVEGLKTILQGALGYLYRERYPSDYPDPGHWSNRAKALLERLGPAAPRVVT